MKKDSLVIYSLNSGLAQTVKDILEETGAYEVKIENVLTTNFVANSDSEKSLVVAEGGGSYYTKVVLNKDLISFGEFVFDPNFRQLQWKNQQSFNLFAKEAEVLLLLLENIGEIVARDFILNSCWGEVSYHKSRCLDVAISKLRKILNLDTSVSIVNSSNRGLALCVE